MKLLCYTYKWSLQDFTSLDKFVNGTGYIEECKDINQNFLGSDY